MKKKNAPNDVARERMSLTLIFSFFVFIILLSALIVAVSLVFLIEFLIGSEATLDTWLILLLTVAASAIIGYVLVLIFSKFPLKPINQLIDGMNKLARGDFSARLKFEGAFYNNSTFREITESFNRMAEDLGNTETLRVDFANNFSHEFKTPIMSIAGFAKVLKRVDLTEEEREQYLTVIESESRRLATMATSILKLTRVENQTIISNKTKVNVSEQIRSAILMLEERWSEKNIELDIDFDDHLIMADGELLKEAWINLVDNAVKYANEGGRVKISVEDLGERVEVGISNTGSYIPEEKIDHIFRKFYQVDESHSYVGSGIGLAIVKRTVELHRGSVRAESVLGEDGLGETTFSVSLPKN